MLVSLCVWSLSELVSVYVCVCVSGLSLGWSLCCVSDVSPAFPCRVPLLRILLTNTKVPRSTKLLVAGVKDKLNKVLNRRCLLTLGATEPPVDSLGPALSASIKHGD